MTDADLAIASSALAGILGMPQADCADALCALEKLGYLVIQPQTPLVLIPVVVTTDAAELYAQAVVVEINRLTGRHFRVTEETITRAKALMRARIKVETMVAVVTFMHGKWAHKPDMAEYVQPSTLMRLSKAKQYIEQMEAGPVRTGRGETHQPAHTTVTAEELRALRGR